MKRAVDFCLQQRDKLLNVCRRATLSTRLLRMNRERDFSEASSIDGICDSRLKPKQEQPDRRLAANAIKSLNPENRPETVCCRCYRCSQ